MSETEQDFFSSIKSLKVRERLQAFLEILGEPNKRQGDEYIWACPCCKEEGGDPDDDNFLFNVKKNKYNCFASNDHTHAISERIKEITNKKKKNKSKNDWQLKTIEPISIPEDEKNFWSLEKKIYDPDKVIKQFPLLWCRSNNCLLIKVGSRYKLKPLDDRPDKWDNQSDVKIEPVYFELTPYSGQKNLLLLEGFSNLFSLASLVTDEFNKEFYTVTSVHGVGSTLSLENVIGFTKFENIFSCLDNDQAGNAEANRIKEKHSNTHIVQLETCDLRDYLNAGQENFFRFYNQLKQKLGWNEAVTKAAWELLRSPDFIDIYLKECSAFGLIGENNTKVQLYLENSSRFSKERNAGISSKAQGPTAVGKTNLYKVVGKNFFEEDFIILTDKSPKVMLRKKKDEWKYKIIMTEENYATKQSTETESKDYQMRIAKSEGILTYEVLVPDEKEGFITKKNELEGPFVFQEATTKLSFKDEDVNRDTVHNFDESSVHTENINKSQKLKASQYLPQVEVLKNFIREKHKKIQQILKVNIPDKIIIPFANQIKFPSHLHRARRDLPRFFRYIEVSAFIHQFQREVLTEEDFLKKYPKGIVANDCALLKSHDATILSNDDKGFSQLLNDLGKTVPKDFLQPSKDKKILIADIKDYELVANYVVPDLAKEYTQLPKVMADRYKLLYDKFGISQDFRSMEAGEILGVSDDTARIVLYQFEKKNLCKVDKQSKCFKYNLKERKISTTDFGLIKLEDIPPQNSFNNQPKVLPALDNIVATPQMQQDETMQKVEIGSSELAKELQRKLQEFEPDQSNCERDGIERVTHLIERSDSNREQKVKEWKEKSNRL